MINKPFLAAVFAVSLLTSLESIAYQAPYAEQAPEIDGVANESAWKNAQWHNIDQLTLGDLPQAADFQGRFKIVWRGSSLYVLAEITDDILIDTHPDPLTAYWEDDTFEVFVDEDKSGGDHLNNYNAFAYHIGLDNQAVDIDQKGQPRLLNEHIQSAWKRSLSVPNVVIWEVRIDVYSDEFGDNQTKEQVEKSLVKLHSGKEMGFMVAYCDSDSDSGRESFIGSKEVIAVNGDKNRAYIDASVFDTLILTK